MDTIISIQPRVGGGDGVKKPEDVVMEVIIGTSCLRNECLLYV